MADGTTECEGKYIDVRFQNIEKIVDRMERAFEKSIGEMKSEAKESNIRFEKLMGEIKSEAKESNIRFEKSIGEMKSEAKESNIRFEKSIGEIKDEVDEIKRDNKATRRWITGTVIGTGIAVVFGIAAIFFSFAQLQTSWMQQVISFAIKTIK